MKAETEKERLIEDVKAEHVKKTSLARILAECKQEWIYLFVGSVGALIRGLVMPAFAFFFASIIETYSLEGDELSSGATFWALMFVAIGVANGLGSLASSYYFGLASERLTKRLRSDVFRNILRQDGTYFDDERHATGKLCTRLSTDAPAVKGAIDFRFSQILVSIVSMIVGLAIAFIYGWKLALLIIAMLPILAASSAINLKLRHGTSTLDTKLLEEAGKVAAESIENIRAVQSLTRELVFYAKFSQLIHRPHKLALRQAHIQGGGYGFAQSCIFFLYAAAFRFGAYLVTIGDMPPLDVYKVFFAIAFCGMTVGFATAYFPEYAKATLSGALIFKMLGETPLIDGTSEEGLRGEIKGALKFSNVHFSYPSRPHANVLSGLTFTADPGQTIALVGQSGCGKSTVVNLLERLYDVSAGSIEVDDFDIRSLNLKHLRTTISLVSQEPILFDVSIRDNITYGVEGSIAEADVVEAAKLANIHDFVVSLPQAYDTPVGEKGTQLSGGQKQRLAIARALIRKPKILLLDEATSALDTESEKIVQEALDRARKGRTCVVIAHRLSTIQNADRILVMKGGQVVEMGTHSELVGKRGFYYALTKKQNLQ